MKRLNKSLFFFVAPILLLAACKPTGRTLPSATGSIYECVVVCDKTLYATIDSVMAADMPCLPQMEPYFNCSNVPPTLFDDFLKSARNVLLVDISDKYVQAKVVMVRNRWSKPQAVCRVQAPDTAVFLAYWSENGKAVREWFVREELARQVRFLRGSTNKDARAALQKRFGCDMLIPEDYMLIKDSGDVVWCCNSKGPVRRDLVIYSYPYTDSLTFTQEYLCRKRDEVLGGLVSGQVAGSYMGTEYRHFPPEMRYVQPLPQIPNTPNTPGNSFYAAEVRGLWRLYGGEAMGGPFVSLSRLDCVNGRVITAEVFVFAAGQKKRNPLRQAEAILYTLRLPEEQSTEY